MASTGTMVTTMPKRGSTMSVTPTEYAGREDYSAGEWRNRVKAARLKVDLDRRRGRATPAWIVELSAEPIPDVPRPTRRRPAA